MNEDNHEEQITILQKILAKLNILTGKRDQLKEKSTKLDNATPKDLTPADVIELFDLKPEDIPAKIVEGFKGIPDHIEVLNEVHLESGSPEEFYGKKGKTE